MKERLEKYRSFRLFMDICVRCGACADKCHFYLGSGDPKNMPVLAPSCCARFIAAISRCGTDLRQAGGRARSDRGRDQGVVLLLLPMHRMPPLFGLLPVRDRHRRDHHDGPRTAEPDRMQHQLGPGAGGQLFPHRNHLGIQPHGFKDSIDFAVDETREITGVRVEASINRKGAEILFVVPSADYFGTPHYYTLLGYLVLLHESAWITRSAPMLRRAATSGCSRPTK